MHEFSVGHWTLLALVVIVVATTVALTLFMDNSGTEKTDEYASEIFKEKGPILFNDAKKFYVIAHRGDKSHYPENTMPAFKAAVEAGADMIELDVRSSKNGIPVVIHDKNVRRTTDGRGSVSNLTVQELKKLDAGSWYAQRFSDVKIPTLEEVLKWARGTVPLNIELKPLPERVANYGGLEEKSVNLVKKYHMEDRVLFSSFYYESIKHIRSMNPEVPTGLLYNWRKSGNLLPSELVLRYEVDAFHCAKDELNRRWIQNLESRSIPLLVYTVNRKRSMKRIYQKGADGIITNRPARLKEVIESVSRETGKD